MRRVDARASGTGTCATRVSDHDATVPGSDEHPHWPYGSSRRAAPSAAPSGPTIPARPARTDRPRADSGGVGRGERASRYAQTFDLGLRHVDQREQLPEEATPVDEGHGSLVAHRVVTCGDRLLRLLAHARHLSSTRPTCRRAPRDFCGCRAPAGRSCVRSRPCSIDRERNRLVRECTARHPAGVQHQVENAGNGKVAIAWEGLYQSWRVHAFDYPELGELSTFTDVQWPAGTYWVPVRPTQVSSITESGSLWVDWWPRTEVLPRVDAATKRTRQGGWRSSFPELPEACRYTLRYVWAARHDPELTAAVWLAATTIMWESSRQERIDWERSTHEMCGRVRHLCWRKMEHGQTGTWPHTCKYPLPEAVHRFMRAPRSMDELVEMAAANAAFVHNRWTLVRLCGAT